MSMLHELESEKNDVLKDINEPLSRDRSVLPTGGAGFRSHSRGRQYDLDNRSLSRARRRANGIKWTILSHDPSERLSDSRNEGEAGEEALAAGASAGSGGAAGASNDEDDNTTEDELVSEEEQISDTDNEFQYDDGGTILPNFATYRKTGDFDESDDETGNKNNNNNNESASDEKIAAAKDALQSVTDKLKEMTIGDSSTVDTNNNTSQNSNKTNKDHKQLEPEDKVVKEAREVARLQEVEAAQKALENAVAVGAPIPKETIEVIRNLSSKELEYINVSLLEHLTHQKLFNDPKEEAEKLAYGASASIPTDKPLKKVSDINLRKYATYKGKITASGDQRSFNAPYTYDSEVEDDIVLAKKLNKKIKIGEIDSSKENSRCIRTITRGDFFENLSIHKKPNSYLICMDFSPESLYALEWCIGTVLSNNSVLFIVYVIEEDKERSINRDLNSPAENDKEHVRNDGVERLTKTFLELIKLTKLQVHAVIEVIHHPIPRHLITEIIDHIQPTLVVVGSRGKSALQGVLLGSLSNYLVTKSSVPVMVVRKELKKTLKKKKLSNNFALVHSLKEARVD